MFSDAFLDSNFGITSVSMRLVLGLVLDGGDTIVGSSSVGCGSRSETSINNNNDDNTHTTHTDIVSSLLPITGSVTDIQDSSRHGSSNLCSGNDSLVRGVHSLRAPATGDEVGKVSLSVPGGVSSFTAGGATDIVSYGKSSAAGAEWPSVSTTEEACPGYCCVPGPHCCVKGRVDQLTPD